MLNLLVIAAREGARKRLGELLVGTPGRIAPHTSIDEARAALARDHFDVALLAPDSPAEITADALIALRGTGPHLPIVVLVASASAAWEEALLAAGADLILREPITPTHLDRAVRLGLARTPPPRIEKTAAAPDSPAAAARHSLETLRDFSPILGHALDPSLFAGQFARRVREIAGVSRIAIFLETPRLPAGDGPSDSRLTCAAAIGIPPDLVDRFELSRTAGIGALLVQAQSPRILVVNEGAGAEPAVRREFDLLACRLAIPISDRSLVIGVALLGARVTPRPYTADERQLLGLLMEELGSAIQETRRQQRVAASHRLLADVLATLGTGCLVVDRGLHILHANRALVAHLRRPPGSDARIAFSDLPPSLAGPLRETLTEGARPEPFFFTGDTGPGGLFHVSIFPFVSGPGPQPQSALLVLEDFTQIDAAKRFEIEASKAKLIALIARRFAHEIRNSLVPLTTHEQLLDTEYQSDEFRSSLKTTLARETTRIGRFTEQMLYLSQPARFTGETADLRDLVEQCFLRLNRTLSPPGRIQLRLEGEPPVVRCHRAALEHAFQEILANALQSRPEDPAVTVIIGPGLDGGIRTTIRDNGPGFTAETARQAHEPFFTSRNTGVGLGLTVARKIIEDHLGRVAIEPRAPNRDHDVEVWLPAAPAV